MTDIGDRAMPIIRGEQVDFLSMRAPMSEAMEEQWLGRMLEAQGKDSYHIVICQRSTSLRPPIS